MLRDRMTVAVDHQLFAQLYAVKNLGYVRSEFFDGRDFHRCEATRACDWLQARELVFRVARSSRVLVFGVPPKQTF